MSEGENWLTNLAERYFAEDCPIWKQGPVEGYFAEVRDALPYSDDPGEQLEEFDVFYELVDEEDDYILQDILNEPCAKNKHLIEYRIKLFLARSVLLEPGAKNKFRTTCMERFWES